MTRPRGSLRGLVPAGWAAPACTTPNLTNKEPVLAGRQAPRTTTTSRSPAKPFARPRTGMRTPSSACVGSSTFSARAALLAALLAPTCGGGERRVDHRGLGDVTFMGPEAINAIREGYVAEEAGVTFRLAHLDGIVERVLKVLGLGHRSQRQRSEALRAALRDVTSATFAAQRSHIGGAVRRCPRVRPGAARPPRRGCAGHQRLSKVGGRSISNQTTFPGGSGR